jgi:hypothetical protein
MPPIVTIIENKLRETTQVIKEIFAMDVIAKAPKYIMDVRFTNT